jgi:hypothetical protein
MRIILLLILFYSVQSCNNFNKPNVVNNTNLRDTAIGLMGASKAKIVDDSTFQYGKVMVKKVRHPSGVGEIISINDYTITNMDAYHFHGLHKDLVFVDNGTSPNYREIVVHNFMTKKEVFRSKYEGEISIKDDILNYIMPIDMRLVRLSKPIPCPESTEWTKKGFNIGYGYPTHCNINTFEVVTSDTIVCFKMQ